MNPYVMLGIGIGTSEAASLSGRLAAWHDAMVAHERRLRHGRADVECGDECPHADAPSLWAEAVEAFGARAQELAFLRSRAASATPPAPPDVPQADAPAEAAHQTRPSKRKSRKAGDDLSDRSFTTEAGELRTRTAEI